MHELGITEEIVAIASERAGAARVLRVKLEIGCLAAILPDAIRFCFDVCAEGTNVEGASLEIVEIPGRGRCRACRAELALERPIAVCACGSWDFDWVAGQELRIAEMEVA